MSTVSVVVATIPTRSILLSRLLASIARQTRLPNQIVVVTDFDHEGAPVMLNRALAAVDCEYVAFIGDDDYFLPHHLAAVEIEAMRHDADIVYPYFETANGVDWLDNMGKEFDPIQLRDANYIHGSGSLVRTAAIRAVGGIPLTSSADWPRADSEDWGLWLRLLDAGYRFVHLPEKTWVWEHGAGHTGGRGDRW